MSPAYYRLRSYDVPGQLGQENSPQEYVANLVAAFEEVKRVLPPDGVLRIGISNGIFAPPLWKPTPSSTR
jgi:hypothetical protein